MEYENQDNDKDFIGHSIQKSEDIIRGKINSNQFM